MKAPLIYLFFLLFAFNFSAEDFSHEEQRMLSTLYVQTAAEHRASVLQTFKTATNLLPEAIENASWNALMEDHDTEYRVGNDRSTSQEFQARE